ncbi:aspartyl protease family protein [Sphingomonas sabuli]|uniref:Aspartyl protease family protein n=1 Tax=Sphingomonas sabuli TaxID=2764186 RepID=A0A7G9L2M7_9SPHN|nr:aspartyl protease family protein [Sphingomonas sabuli]QNM82876.1 aspartyl protease family protein [Sphingomonas sabuli]
MSSLPFLLLAAAAAAPVPIRAPAPPSILETERGAVDRETQAKDVAIRRDIDDRLTVGVTISGAGPYRFLVDTGADSTAVSSSLVNRLSLLPGEGVSLHSMTGVSAVRTVQLPAMQLGNAGQIKIAEAPVLEADHMGADGILGTDSLRSQRVVFDFDRNRMTIVPSQQPVERDDGTIIVTGRLKNGRLIVTNALADDTPVTVVLDTGSEITVGNEALRQRLARGGQLTSSGPVELQSVTGAMLPGEYMFLKELEMRDVKLKQLAVVFAPAHTFHKLGLDDKPALLLGMNALKAFRKVSIDFANRKLRVLLRDSSSRDEILLAAR